MNINRKSGNIEIQATLVSTQPITLELFNAFNTFAQTSVLGAKIGAEFNGRPVHTITQWQALGTIIPAPTVGDITKGIVGFNELGGITFTSNLGVSNSFNGQITTTQQNQYLTYRGLLEYTKNKTFTISKIKFAVVQGNAVSQFNNEWEYFKTNVFGDYNTIETKTPINSFSPNQIQSNILDMDVNWKIDGYTGIKFTLEPNIFIKVNFTIELE